jgi:putative ABC transport system ATP-binding protein
MKLLQANNLSHSFEYKLFSDISLTLSKNESIAIIGSSGSGKSTLLHILSTLLTPKYGEVIIMGKDISTLSKKDIVRMKRDDLGLVFQSHYLFKGFSALENLEVSAMLSKRDIDEELLKRLNIQDVVLQKVTELSGGQQQRVSIARVLTKKPHIIFADEPTGNLDKKTANEVIELFFEYIEKNNAGMVLVTHDESLAYKCDKVYRLENKELKKVK